MGQATLRRPYPPPYPARARIGGPTCLVLRIPYTTEGLLGWDAFERLGPGGRAPTPTPALAQGLLSAAYPSEV